MGSMEEVDNDEDQLVNEIDSFLIEDDDIWRYELFVRIRINYFIQII